MTRLRSLVLLAAVVFALSACEGYQRVDYDYDVRYEVEASCNTFVTYEAAGGVAQTDAGPSWWYERTAWSGDFLYVSAQLQCDGGSVTTRILTWDSYGTPSEPAGWRVEKEVTSSGAYVIATVSDSY